LPLLQRTGNTVFYRESPDQSMEKYRQQS